MAVILYIILFLLSPSCSLAGDTTVPDAKSVSEIDGVRVRQIGGDKVLVELSGRSLRLPSCVSASGCAAVLQWSDTVFSRDLAKIFGGENEAELYFDYPLASRLGFHRDNDYTITMRLTGEKSLILTGVRGMESTDSLTLLLEAVPPPEKRENAAVAVHDPILSRGDKITLEMRDVPPINAFRMLASIAGLNLVADKSVPSGGMTLSFKEAPLGEVFGCILGVNGLVHAVRGSTIIIGASRAVAEAAGADETRIYRIAYSDVAKAASIIGTMVSDLKKTVVDEPSRTLYITGTAAQHQETAALLAKIDYPGRQVMLEARLIEINKADKHEVEAMLSAIYKGWVITGTAGAGALRYGCANVDDGPVFTDVPDPTIKLLDAGLYAMESERKGKILASPSIVALDGHKAVIKLTRNYLYQSSTDSKGNAKFTEQETGPSLEITPLIGRDGIMTMNLKISTGEIIGFRKSGISEVPETSRREVDTCVRVRDGEPFVIGGLYAENKSKNVSRTPVLGYIPLLGELFTSRSDVCVSSELAFIVVPHILDIPPQEIPAIFPPAEQEPCFIQDIE